MDAASSQQPLRQVLITLLLLYQCDVSTQRLLDGISLSNWSFVYQQFCGYKCVEGKLIVEPDNCDCFACECGGDCALKGTCCPSGDVIKVERDVDLLPGSLYHLYRSSECLGLDGYDNARYLAIGKCPDIWEDSGVKERCENEHLMSTVENITPYTEPETGLTFRNIFCVICHGFESLVKSSDDPQANEETSLAKPAVVESLTPWLIGVDGGLYQNNIVNYTDISDLLNQTRWFHFRLRPVNIFPSVKKCQWYAKYEEWSSCPRGSDTVINDLCRDLPAMFSLKSLHSTNLFCDACNDLDLDDYLEYCRSALPHVETYPDEHLYTIEEFSSGAGAEPVTVDGGCGQFTLANTQNDCARIHCSPGKVLGVGRDHCETAIRAIGRLRYSLHAVFVARLPSVYKFTDVIFNTELHKMMNTLLDTPQYRIPIENMLRPFQYAFHDKVKECFAEYYGEDEEDDDGDYDVNGDNNNNTTNNGVDKTKNNSSDFDMHNGNNSNDDNRTNTNNANDNSSNSSINGLYEKTYLYELYISMENIQNRSIRYRDDFETFLLSLLTHTQFAVIINYAEDPVEVALSLVCLGEELCDLYQSPSEYKTCEVRSNLSSVDIRQELNNRELIDITPSLVCPYVSTRLVTKPIVFVDGVVFSIRLNDRVVNISDAGNVSFQNGELQICLSHVDELVRQIGENELDSRTSYDNSLLNINLSLYSIVNALSCLLVLAFVITHLVFPSPRSVIGLNTICLSTCLLTAQVCLIVTFIFSSRGSLGKVHCLIQGVFLHYSWLASFLWINAFSIQMYRTYTSHITLPRNGRLFMNDCIFSFGCPLLIVLVVIIASTTLTSGASVGYSESACFLDTDKSYLITILALVVPLGSSVLVNWGVLSLIITSKMKSYRKTSERPKVKAIDVYAVTTSAFITTICFIGVVMAVTQTVFEFRGVELLFIFSLFATLEIVCIFMSLFWKKQAIKNICKKPSSISKKQ